MVSQSSLIDFAQQIAQVLHAERVILFGSYAAGHADEDSDVDFLVVAPTDLVPPRRNLAAKEISRRFKVSSDIIVKTPEEFEYWRDTPGSLIFEALCSGKVLYERTDR